MEYKDLFEENKSLKEEILRLKEENIDLKNLLTKKNYSINTSANSYPNHNLEMPVSSPNTVNKDACINYISKESSIEDKINLYRRLFKGREDLFALRWERKDDIQKASYSPYCINIWKPVICDKHNIRCNQCENRNLKPLADKDINEHLKGIKTIGMYPLLKGDLCHFFAVDFDGDILSG